MQSFHECFLSVDHGPFSNLFGTKENLSEILQTKGVGAAVNHPQLSPLHFANACYEPNQTVLSGQIFQNLQPSTHRVVLHNILCLLLIRVYNMKRL